MKRWLLALLLWGSLLGLITPTAFAQSLDEQYVRIYNLIQQADSQNAAGQLTDALARYVEAQTALSRVQKSYPDWNQRLISFRLEYVADKISGLTARSATSTTAPTAPVKPGVTNVVNAAPQPTPASSPADQQVAELREQVRLLQGDKIILEAKLKEALAAQPAAIDPRELAKVNERVQSLSKENELLKASLADEKNKPAAVDQKQLEAARAESAKFAELLRTENELLKKQVATLQSAKPSRRDSANQQKLTEAEARYAALQSEVEILKLEKSALQTQVRSMTNTVTRAVALRQEDQKRIQTLEADHAEMQRKLAATPTATSTPTTVIVATNRLEDAARIKQLESETDALRSQLAARPTTPSSRPEDAQRIKLLEQERSQLQKDLDAANQKIASREGRAAARKIEQLTSEIEKLQARVQVFEARALPYSAEELALFKAPVAAPAPREPSTTKAVSSRELPAGSAGMAAEAKRQFANRDFAKAEASYQQILRLDATNAYALANLAAIQIEQGKLDDADKNLRTAIASSPQDTYSLSLFGILCFRREKYDEALDALSKAAKLDPQNAEVQNYLGMALSEKGLRGPAETALRKAIELEPNNGSAHNNLAVIYLSQTPPLVELARWHYQKALAAKHPRNLDLEKMLDEKSKAK